MAADDATGAALSRRDARAVAIVVAVVLAAVMGAGISCRPWSSTAR